MVSFLQLLQQTDMRAVVVLICGCCPGGTLSNILALAVQGDMNLRYKLPVWGNIIVLTNKYVPRI